jgi:hypothetical protein
MMKRFVCGALAVAVAYCFGTVALAGPGCCKSKESAAKATTVAMKDGCCASKGFPAMAMKVGDKTYNCPMEAGKAAEQAKGKVVYVVAGESFECKDKAEAALAAASEDFVKKFTTIACVVDGQVKYCDEKEMASCKSMGEVKTCSKSGEGARTASVSLAASESDAKHGTCDKSAKKAGEPSATRTRTTVAQGKTDAKSEMHGKNMKFMVAGHTYESMEAAQKAREGILAAIKPVSMKYVVDGKEVDCATKVCPSKKAAGQVTFVVNKDKTTNETSARVWLAKALYEAAKAAADKDPRT